MAFISLVCVCGCCCWEEERSVGLNLSISQMNEMGAKTKNFFWWFHIPFCLLRFSTFLSEKLLFLVGLPSSSVYLIFLQFAIIRNEITVIVEISQLDYILIYVWLPRKSDFAKAWKRFIGQFAVSTIVAVVVAMCTFFFYYFERQQRNNYAFRRCSRSFFGSIWSVSWWNSTRIHSPIENWGTCTNALHATLTGQFARGVWFDF